MYKCQNTFINNNDIYLLKSYTSISYKPSKTQSVIVWVCKKPKYNFLLFSLTFYTGRNRNWKVIWLNPPHSQNVKTNISEMFIKLVRKLFPKATNTMRFST